MSAFHVGMSCYLRRRSGQNDPNANRLDLGPITVWFSYTTPVAFMVAGESKVVRRNEWGPTTGKHLNAIDQENHAARVAGPEFMRLLEARCGRFFCPRDLDADCPAGIVSDWLRDRGLNAAADAILAHEAV